MYTNIQIYKYTNQQIVKGNVMIRYSRHIIVLIKMVRLIKILTNESMMLSAGPLHSTGWKLFFSSYWRHAS